MTINTTKGYASGGTKNTLGTTSGTTISSLVVTNDADIGGNVTVGGNLAVTGSFSSSSYNPASITSGSITATTALTTTGATVTMPTMTGDTTLNGNLTVTGTVTSGGGGATSFSKIYVADAASGTSSANATIATYSSASTSNYLQVQTSSTTAGSGTGTLIGVDGTEAIVYNRTTNGNIVLQSDSSAATTNGAVRLRRNILTIRPDSILNDGTYSTNALIGCFTNQQTANYAHFQNSTTAALNSNQGSVSGSGTIVGANGLVATLRELDTGGSCVIQCPNGSITLNADGTVTLTGALTVPTKITYPISGAICSQTFFNAGRAMVTGDPLWVGVGVSNEPARYVLGSPTTTASAIIAFAGWRQDTTNAMTFRLLKNGTPTTGVDVSFAAGAAAAKNGNVTNANASLGPTNNWGYQLQTGSFASAAVSEVTLTVYYRIG